VKDLEVYMSLVRRRYDGDIAWTGLLAGFESNVRGEPDRHLSPTG